MPGAGTVQALPLQASEAAVPDGPGLQAANTTIRQAARFEDAQSEGRTGWQCTRSKEPGAEPLRPRDGKSLQSRRNRACCRRCAYRARKDATRRGHSHQRASQTCGCLHSEHIVYTTLARCRRPPASGERIPQQAKWSSVRLPEVTRAHVARARAQLRRTRTPACMHTHRRRWPRGVCTALQRGATQRVGACLALRPADFRGRDRFALFAGRRSTLRVARQAALRLAHPCVLCSLPRRDPNDTPLFGAVGFLRRKSKSIRFPPNGIR